MKPKRPKNPWPKHMKDLLHFMRYELHASHYFCFDVMKREYPSAHFTEMSIRVQGNKLKNYVV
jgi:hypothetical protein